VFWFRLPLAALALLLSPLLTKSGVVPGEQRRQPFDTGGAIALTLTLVLLLLAINRAGSTGLSLTTVLFAAAGGAGAVVFVRHELRSRTPLMNLALFRRPPFAIANLAHTLAQLAGFAVLLLCPYYLLAAVHDDIVKAGMLLALSLGAMALASALAGSLLQRYSAAQTGLAAAALLTAGLAGIACWPAPPAIDFLLIAVSLLAHGAGLGLFQVVTMEWIMAMMPPNAQGVAGSLVMLTRTIGAVIGASACFAWFQWLAGPAAAGDVLMLNPRFIDAFHGTFWAAAAIAGLSFMLLLLPARSANR
jgi:MFS family permease